MKQILADALTLARKEVKQLYRDPTALALTFIVPLVMVGALGFAVIGAYGGSGDTKIAIAVVDEDQTRLSAAFRDSLASVAELRESITPTTKQQAENLVQSSHIAAALIIPEGFEHHLKTRHQSFLILFADNSKHSAPGVVQSAISKAIVQFESQLASHVSNDTVRISIDTRTLTGRQSGAWAFMPGLLAIAIMLSSFDDVVVAISRESERGTLTRLGLTPINLVSFYLGKTVSTVVLTIARTTEMLLVFVFILGVPLLGNLALVYLVTVAVGVCTLALGFALSTKLRGETTITFVEIIATFPLLALTGVLFPIELMAEDGRRVAWMLPWTYGVDALRRVMSLGQGFLDIARDLSVLLLATGIFMSLAVILFRRRM